MWNNVLKCLNDRDDNGDLKDNYVDGDDEDANNGDNGDDDDGGSDGGDGDDGTDDDDHDDDGGGSDDGDDGDDGDDDDGGSDDDGDVITWQNSSSVTIIDCRNTKTYAEASFSSQPSLVGHERNFTGCPNSDRTWGPHTRRTGLEIRRPGSIFCTTSTNSCVSLDKSTPDPLSESVLSSSYTEEERLG